MDSSRPSDYDDGRTPFEPEGAASNPRLGPLGWLRWAWRQLTSMRTALLLLLLLAIAAVPGSLFPQRSSDPNGVVQYIAANPRLSPVLESMQLFDVYSSFWFSAIYLLLFVSLIGCVLPRAKHHWKALRTEPPRTPARLSRMSGYRSVSAVGEPAAMIESARALLRSSGYRVVDYRSEARAGQPGNVSVSAERGYLRETGNLIFHSALVGVLLSVALGGLYGYTAQKIVVVGQSMVDAVGSFDSYSPGRLVDSESLPPFAITLDDFEVTYEDQAGAGYGAVLDYTASVTARHQGASEHGVIRVNSPLNVAGTETYLLGNGYAPQVTVRDPAGTIVFTDSVPFLPQDRNLTSLGIIKVPDGLAEQLGMIGFFYPTQAENQSTGAFFSSFPDLKNPLLTLEVYQGDLGIDNGVPRSVYELKTADLTQIAGRRSDSPTIELAIGDTVQLPNGLGSISLDAAPRYASLEVHRDPAQGYVFVFALLAITGLIVSLFIPRRRLWVKASSAPDGQVLLEYAGLARGEDPGLEQAVTDLVERHGRTLRLES